MAMKTLLQRQNDEGIFRVFYMDEEHLNTPESEPGIYADIVYFRGRGPKDAPHGFNRLCASYREAANEVFRAFGEYPDYAL